MADNSAPTPESTTTTEPNTPERTTPDTAPPDAAPFHTAGPSFATGLSGPDLAWLIQEATDCLAAHGLSVHNTGDGALSTRDGQVLGLLPLAQRLSATPRDEWSSLVARFCEMLAVGPPDRPTDVEEFRRRLRPRVMAAEFFHTDMPAYARSLGAGLHQLAALQYDGLVVLLLADDDLDLLGGWDGAEQTAIANLRRHPVRHELYERKRELDAAIHVFSGQHKYVASHLIVLDELMASVGAETRGKPLLVGLPTREELLVHIPVGPSVEMVMDVLAEYCLPTFRRSPGALSPDVYFRDASDRWHAIRVKPLTNGLVTLAYDDGVAAFMASMVRKAKPWYGAAS